MCVWVSCLVFPRGQKGGHHGSYEVLGVRVGFLGHISCAVLGNNPLVFNFLYNSMSHSIPAAGLARVRAGRFTQSKPKTS